MTWKHPVKPVVPSGSSGPTDQHRDAVLFPLVQNLEGRKRSNQVALFTSEPPWARANLTQRGDGKNTAGSKPIEHGFVKSRVAEHMTEDQRKRRSVRQAIVQIEILKTAVHTLGCCQFPCMRDRHRRDVDPENVEAATSQPNGSPAPATGNIDGGPSGRKVIDGVCEVRRWFH